MRSYGAQAGISAIFILLFFVGGCGGAGAQRAAPGADVAPPLAAASDPRIPGGLALTPRILAADQAVLRRLGLPVSPDGPVRICRDVESLFTALEMDPRGQIVMGPPVTPRPGAEAVSVFADEVSYTRDAAPIDGGLSPITDRIRYGDEFIVAAERRGGVVVLRRAGMTSVILLGLVECRGRAADGAIFHWQEPVVAIGRASLPQPIELRPGEAVAIPRRYERRRGTAAVRQYLQDIHEGPEPRLSSGSPTVFLVTVATLPADEGSE